MEGHRSLRVSTREAGENSSGLVPVIKLASRDS